MELKFDKIDDKTIMSRCKDFVGVFELKPKKYYCRYKMECKNYKQEECYIDIEVKRKDGQ